MQPSDHHGADDDPDALDKSNIVSNSRANIFLVDQVVKLIVNSNCELTMAEGDQIGRKGKGKGGSVNSYPYKMVEEHFLKLVTRILTMDGKAQIVKLLIDALSKIYEKIARKDFVKDHSQPAHKLLTKVIGQLCEIHMLSTLSTTLLTRTTVMLSHVVLITKRHFSLRCSQTYRLLRDCIVKLLAET